MTTTQPIFLNLLVFDSEFKNGATQLELVEQASDLGFEHIEIRREYFRDLKNELAPIRDIAKRRNLTLFYSIPDQLYLDGYINPHLQDYLEEALFLGVSQVKFTIGEFKNDLLTHELKALLKKGIAIAIENDQTAESGKIATIASFMKKIKEAQLPIGYVFDLGNFRFVDENEQDALDLLASYVTYLHLKDVTFHEDKPVATDLDLGVIDWKQAINALPDIPVAIEYPTQDTATILRAKEKIQEVLVHE
ncbi:sugar phosphate isomerase/epimerase family protein [Enterococcus bulliens]